MSTEVKVSKGSLMIFTVASKYQMVVYEMPYINLKRQGMPDAAQIEEIAAKAQDFAIKVQTLHEYVSDPVLQLVPEIVQDCFQDTVKWYAHHASKKSEPAYFEQLEAVLIALIYKRFDCEAQNDWSWNIVISPVVDGKQESAYEIHSTHSLPESKPTDKVGSLRYH